MSISKKNVYLFRFYESIDYMLLKYRFPRYTMQMSYTSDEKEFNVYAISITIYDERNNKYHNFQRPKQFSPYIKLDVVNLCKELEEFILKIFNGE